MITIQFWSDFMCPFCYIGEKRIKDVVAAMGLEDRVTYKMKAFELDPTTGDNPQDKAIPLMAKRRNMPLEDAEKRAQYIEKLAHEVGLDFHYADMQFVNTMKAHALIKYTQTLNEADKTNELVDRLFKAVFIDGTNVSDVDFLVQTAADCGFDAKKARDAIESHAYEAVVRQEEIELGMLGASSVPLFVIGNKGIPGVPSTQGVQELLEEAMQSEKIEMVDTTKKDDNDNDDMTGMSCGINGCGV